MNSVAELSPPEQRLPAPLEGSVRKVYVPEAHGIFAQPLKQDFNPTAKFGTSIFKTKKRKFSNFSSCHTEKHDEESQVKANP